MACSQVEGGHSPGVIAWLGRLKRASPVLAVGADGDSLRPRFILDAGPSSGSAEALSFFMDVR